MYNPQKRQQPKIRSNAAVLRTPKQVSHFIKHHFLTQDKEQFFCIHMDTRHKPIDVDLVSMGTINASLVHPREVFRAAIINNAANIIFVHNHPAGNPEPSADDIDITKRLYEASMLLGIEVLDHIITTADKDQYYSFREEYGDLSDVA